MTITEFNRRVEELFPNSTIITEVKTVHSIHYTEGDSKRRSTYYHVCVFAPGPRNDIIHHLTLRSFDALLDKLRQAVHPACAKIEGKIERPKQDPDDALWEAPFGEMVA